jgi:hypothetical protein
VNNTGVCTWVGVLSVFTRSWIFRRWCRCNGEWSHTVV